MRWHDVAPVGSRSLRWLTTSIRSLSGLLAQPDRPADPTSEERTEDVRQTMLELMACAGLEVRSREVCNKIRFANSIQTLWYVRSDLMAALANAQGEELARQRLDDVSRLFKGLLPEAQSYRPQRRLR